MIDTISRDVASPSFAHRVASLVGAAAVELGFRADPGAAEQALLALIQDPVELFERHPAWPSRLTGVGQPVELSLKLEPGSSALRWAVDVTDHRADPAGNWSRYLAYAAHVTRGTGADAEVLWRLCHRHLAGVPSACGTRVVHGSGLAPTQWSRGSLYFNTLWLGREELDRRFPRESAALNDMARLHGTPLAGDVDVLGYDFVAGAAMRTKAYVRPTLGAETSFEEMAGRHPDLAPARILFDALGSASDPVAHSHPHLLQVSLDDDEQHQRLYFFGSAWGWDTEAGLELLLGILGGPLSVDLEPLRTLGDLAAAAEVPLRLAMIAVGACENGTSVTFYMWPQHEGGARGIEPALALHSPRTARRGPSPAAVARDRALAYLAGCRASDGSWRDYDTSSSQDSVAPSATFVTAYVGAVLPNVVDDSGTGCLLEAYRDGLGWSFAAPVQADLETTAMALLALARRGAPAPPGALAALQDAYLAAGREGEDAPAPEVVATVLLALLSSGCRQFAPVIGAVFAVAGGQEPDGRWRACSWRDDLAATWWALRALRAYREHELAASPLSAASVLAARVAARRAMDFLATVPVAAEPWSLALWLGSWVAAGGAVDEPRVERVQSALLDRQRPDGRWLGGPHRRSTSAVEGRGWTPSPSGATLVDDRCVMTTATVAGALDAVLDARPA